MKCYHCNRRLSEVRSIFRNVRIQRPHQTLELFKRLLLLLAASPQAGSRIWPRYGNLSNNLSILRLEGKLVSVARHLIDYETALTSHWAVPPSSLATTSVELTRD